MNVSGIILGDFSGNGISQLLLKRQISCLPFGGRYTLLDFPVSNMINSNISDISIVKTGLNNNHQKHTQNFNNKESIFDGIKFIDISNSRPKSLLDCLINLTELTEKTNSEYIVISDCDYIFNMDLKDILDYHKSKNADITFATKDIFSNAYSDSLFFDTTDDNRVINFISDTGNLDMRKQTFIKLWVINKNVLQKIIFEARARNFTDLKRDILIPQKDKLKMYVYIYRGFVTHIDSLLSYFKSNMDLLDLPFLKSALFEVKERPIRTFANNSSPIYFGKYSQTSKSIIGDGCYIKGRILNSVIFPNVKIGKNVTVENSVLFSGTEIEDNSTLNFIVCDNNSIIKKSRKLSGAPTLPFYISEGSVI